MDSAKPAACRCLEVRDERVGGETIFQEPVFTAGTSSGGLNSLLLSAGMDSKTK